MPYYTYEGRDKKGRLVRNQAFAPTQQNLIASLQNAGIIILSIKSAAAIGEHKNRMHKKVKNKDLVLFAKELAVLIENGIPMIDALDVILKQMTSEKLAAAVLAIKKDLENGATLHGSLAKMPHIFGDLWTYLVEAGEVSSQMPFVLKHIQFFLESREEIRKKTINAMIYPAILMTATMVALIIFSFKIIPMFREIYVSLGATKDLPSLTQGVLFFSGVIKNEFLLIVSGIVLAVFLVKQIMTTSSGRRAYEKILFSSPVLGELCIALVVEKFSTTLQVLLKSGIPVIRALEMAANTAGNHLFAEKIEEAKAKVMAGLPLGDALQHTGLFPPIAISFILVAEKTGNYSGMFEEVARYHKDIIETTIIRVMALIEPVMLVLMSLVIGVIVIAMFLPIFRLANM